MTFLLGAGKIRKLLKLLCGYGGIGRRAGFRFLWSDPCGFDPHYPYQSDRLLYGNLSFCILRQKEGLSMTEERINNYNDHATHMADIALRAIPHNTPKCKPLYG